MDFLKRNASILTLIVITIFAVTGLFEFQEQSDSELDRGSQKVTSFMGKDILTHLKLGLDLVGGSQFEFEAQPTEQVTEITPQVMRGLVKVFENRVNASGTTEAVVQQVGKKRILVEVPGEDPTIVKRRLLATAQLEFKRLDEAHAELMQAKVENGEIENFEAKWLGTGITGANLKRAQASTDGTANWAIDFELKPDAAKKFGDLTSELIEKPLAIFLDGNLISAPTVRSAITAGKGQITGRFTAEEAQDLAVQLNAGALPVPVKILQERSIGASLGKESIEKSLKAGLYGLLTVVLFMIAIYRFSGIVAALALSLYVILTLYIFQDAITLTLAGLAGFILSSGMAVDANILIFERAKEEMRAGKSVVVGMRDGFDRAYNSIFDSNMNTSIVCLILIIFGTGIVKGFAITLLIGVAVSLFSSLFITKTLIFNLVKTLKIKEASLF